MLFDVMQLIIGQWRLNWTLDTGHVINCDLKPKVYRSEVLKQKLCEIQIQFCCFFVKSEKIYFKK